MNKKDRRKGGILTLVRNNLNTVENESHKEKTECKVTHFKHGTVVLDLLNYYYSSEFVSLVTTDLPLETLTATINAWDTKARQTG